MANRSKPDPEARDRDDGDVHRDETAPEPPQPTADEATVVTDGGTVTGSSGASGSVTAEGEQTQGDGAHSSAEPTDTSGPDVLSATAPGGPQDHLGMIAEPDDHIPDVHGHRALVGEGSLPGSAGGSMSSVAQDPGGFDRSSVVASPRDDERTVSDDDDPFGQRSDPFAGFDQVQDRPGSLYDNPAVVGADREAEMLAAADPDLGSWVDMDGIVGGQVGGTIDGRTPDGGAGGHSSGFSSTAGYDPGNVLDGATSAALTNPFAAANAVQKGIEMFGHGGFSVYDASTGAAVYGPGVSSGNGASIAPNSGTKGGYIVVEKGAEYQGGQLTSSSSSPLSAPVKTGGAEGVQAQGGESVHANEPVLQKVVNWITHGSSTSPKAEALEQAMKEIDAVGTEPPVAPERPDDGPETEMPADPDAGGPPPAGLDLSKEWAIKVWAKENADINPNPMADVTGTSATEPMDIGGFVEQYDEPQTAPTADPQALLDAHKDTIGEQFSEFDG